MTAVSAHGSAGRRGCVSIAPLCAWRRSVSVQYLLHAVITVHEARAARQALRHHPVPLPDALKSGFHGVRTRWIRGSMAFELARAHPDQGAQFLGERYDAVTIG